MFEITGRQYKALAEVAKCGKKNKVAELSSSIALSDGHLLLTDNAMVVSIEDDRLHAMPNVVYTVGVC